jgi:hypothetical protein
MLRRVFHILALAALVAGAAVRPAESAPSPKAPPPAEKPAEGDQAYPPILLPPNVDAAVKLAFPQARIILLRLQTLHALELYDVFLQERQVRFNTWVTKEGLILSVVRPMSVSEFPKIVAAVITETAAGAKIEKTFRVEWRGKLTTAPAGAPEPATAAGLDTPEVIYRATLLSKQGERSVLEVDAAGNVVRAPKWEMKEKKPPASPAPKPPRKGEG